MAHVAEDIFVSPRRCKKPLRSPLYLACEQQGSWPQGGSGAGEASRPGGGAGPSCDLGKLLGKQAPGGLDDGSGRFSAQRPARSRCSRPRNQAELRKAELGSSACTHTVLGAQGAARPPSGGPGPGRNKPPKRADGQLRACSCAVRGGRAALLRAGTRGPALASCGSRPVLRSWLRSPRCRQAAGDASGALRQDVVSASAGRGSGGGGSAPPRGRARATGLPCARHGPGLGLRLGACVPGAVRRCDEAPDAGRKPRRREASWPERRALCKNGRNGGPRGRVDRVVGPPVLPLQPAL